MHLQFRFLMSFSSLDGANAVAMLLASGPYSAAMVAAAARATCCAELGELLDSKGLDTCPKVHRPFGFSS